MPLDFPLGSRRLTNAVSGPANASPDRRPLSIRRTSTLDMDWPDGIDGTARVRGRARDLLMLDSASQTKTLSDDVLMARIGEGRVYESLFTFPDRPALQAMVGVRGPGTSRRAMSALVPEERDGGTPLYLLLDDLPAICLVSGQMEIEWFTAEQRKSRRLGSFEAPVGICAGYQAGSNAILPDGSGAMIHEVQAVAPLLREDDPLAWHAHQPDTEEPSMRRARRIDIWVDGVVHIDAFFQDSCMTPSGQRVSVHEYCLDATADPETGELLSITADPRVLPFSSCPQAAGNVGRMIGVPLREFRSAVLEHLSGTLGCTHLNDALRALAEVPVLVTRLS